MCGTRAWCTYRLVCVCLAASHSPTRLTIFYVECTRLGWNYFISFVFCVRDKGLVHAPTGVRVSSAPHAPTRLTIFLCCVHASELELFYLVRVLCAGQGPGAHCCCCCGYAFSTSLPHPLDLFLCCMHASGLELFYLVRVLCAGQGPGARTGWCACAFSTSLPHPLDYFFYVACTRLGWNYFISFAFCVRDKGLVHAPTGGRVPSAPHSPTRLTFLLCCVHASGLELFYLVRVLCAGQGPGARTGWCACTFSTSLPHPLDYFLMLRARVWVGIILSRSCFVCGTGAWCTLPLLLCIYLQPLNPTHCLIFL